MAAVTPYSKLFTAFESIQEMRVLSISLQKFNHESENKPLFQSGELFA
jgi:hypothetical protein